MIGMVMELIIGLTLMMIMMELLTYLTLTGIVILTMTAIFTPSTGHFTGMMGRTPSIQTSTAMA
jgi:hypothetical protein